jgi:hypothetical protein
MKLTPAQKEAIHRQVRRYAAALLLERSAYWLPPHDECDPLDAIGKRGERLSQDAIEEADAEQEQYARKLAAMVKAGRV